MNWKYLTLTGVFITCVAIKLQHMRLYTILIFILVALTSCASPSTEVSSYNKGVNAYRIKDFASAREHWSKAIEQGDATAMNNLGYLLFEGLGGKYEIEQAIALWKRGAMLKNSEAQWHLGQAYEIGKGVESDIVEAYAWYRCAISNAQNPSNPNHAETEAKILQGANKSLVKLLEKLPPEQFVTAELLAKQYLSKYVR